MTTKYDFKTIDNRIAGILLVRLNFVETWSAKRTLSYFQSIRRNTERFYSGYFIEQESNIHAFDNIMSLKIMTDPDAPMIIAAHAAYIQLDRYKNSLKAILDRKGDIKEKHKSHKRAYLVR